jgi:hypothetical protein
LLIQQTEDSGRWREEGKPTSDLRIQGQHCDEFWDFLFTSHIPDWMLKKPVAPETQTGSRKKPQGKPEPNDSLGRQKTYRQWPVYVSQTHRNACNSA